MGWVVMGINVILQSYRDLESRDEFTKISEIVLALTGLEPPDLSLRELRENIHRTDIETD